MDNKNKHKSREWEWHPRRNWLRRYLNDLRKFYYQDKPKEKESND